MRPFRHELAMRLEHLYIPIEEIIDSAINKLAADYRLEPGEIRELLNDYDKYVSPYIGAGACMISLN